jgi:hypothetical protein
MKKIHPLWNNGRGWTHSTIYGIDFSLCGIMSLYFLATLNSHGPQHPLKESNILTRVES